MAFLLMALNFPQAAFCQSSVFQHSQKQVLEEYPDLGIKDSAFNIAFVQAVKERRMSSPGFFANSEWPLILAHSIAPERVFLKFTVFQRAKNGALLNSYVGTNGKVEKLVDWAAPSLLDGHRRCDIVVEPGIVWSDEKMMIFVAGLKGYYDNQSGEIAVYSAGDYNYSTVLGAAKTVPRFATSVSLALQLASDQ